MDIRDFKNDAKRAADYLAEQGIEVPHTRLLEALSRAFGARNWSTLREQLRTLPAQADAPKPDTAEAARAWNPSQGLMPAALFVQYGGSRCPVCGSDDVEGDTVQADGANAWDESRCNHCGSSWNTGYTVNCYFDVQPGARASEAQALPFAPGVSEANRTMLAGVPEDGAIVLIEYCDEAPRWRAQLFEAPRALAALLDGVDETFGSLTELVGRLTDDTERALQDLEEHAVVATLGTPWRGTTMMQALVWARRHAQSFGKTLLEPVREDVVSDLVEDVKARSREYDFTIRSFDNALELVDEASRILKLEPTELERTSAANTLY